MFSQQKETMDEGLNDALNGLKDLSDTIAKELQQLTTASDDTAQRMTEVGDAFAARARQINLAVQTAAAQTDEAGMALAQRVERWVAQQRDTLADLERSVEAMGRQAESLQAASREAGDNVERIRATEFEARRDSFLRSASEIMSQLNAASVDMSRLLQSGIPADAWAKYQAGDRGFFARRLLKIRDDGAIPIVRRKYTDDSEFRAHVDRFLRQFEKLEEKALEIDPDRLLHQALVTGDIGKVFVLLSEALGRRH